MPAFDPVRDAVLNSPVDRPRRATHLSNLLNSDHESLQHAEPISARRPSMQLNHITSIPYNPTTRKSPPGLLNTPLSPQEIEMFKNYRGQGAMLLIKRRRGPSPPHDPERPPKRHTGDVGVVVDHYNSRRDVGVEERMTSPIIGLKNFNNWVKSVLISRFAHTVLAKSNVGSGTAGGRARNPPRGKVLDMGCGKGGDINKWSKANVKELYCVDIAAVSVDQARSRYETMKHSRFDAHFAALDCYTEPLSKAFTPAQLSTHFDVVSMQFCMHYAFETLQKVRCMLDNVSRYLRPGGIFIGTIPNSAQLLENLQACPPDDLSFGNSIYKITFEERERRQPYGHKYWFFLQDAVDNVPEYVVHWERFEELAAEYGLHLVYKKEFHDIFEQFHDIPEFKELMIRMKVVDAEGASAMDDHQWEAANIYVGFAFEKR